MAQRARSPYFPGMATVKKGMLTRAGEWWKHLRRTKRAFWKGERQAAKREADDQGRAHGKTAPNKG